MSSGEHIHLRVLGIEQRALPNFLQICKALPNFLQICKSYPYTGITSGGGKNQARGKQYIDDIW
jgi:hypothetical protein